MSCTPPLPDWIRSARVPGYTTAHATCPTETRLYGTETLYGDWNARVLLLAKDFAASRVLDERRTTGDARPYRHEPGLLTNKRLARFAGPLASCQDPLACGLLYGSALANLLRDDGRMSGSLPNRRAAMEYGVRVLGFVLEHLPRLELIVCMGREAWDVTAAGLRLDVPWTDAARGGGLQPSSGPALVVVPHPAARLALTTHERAWERAGRRIRAD